MTDQAQQPKDRLVADLKLVIADAEELLAETASHTGECIGELRERMQDNLRNARHRLGELEDAVAVKTREAVRATDHYVHENPWKAVGMAAGAGLIIGLLISRR
jgi:ElaB/YqjD/DUF883 family membrane-anchored ribosome-binding protein